LRKTSFLEIVNYFALEKNTIDFIGHAVALYTNDDFLNKPALETIQKIKLYMGSVGLFGDSPFIYPIYGLGGIPEGFSRMCAVHGGTFMLNTDIDGIVFENGKVVGVKKDNLVTKTNMVVCSPSYAIAAGL
jgi:Rab GDP dissociation inhibitor